MSTFKPKDRVTFTSNGTVVGIAHKDLVEFVVVRFDDSIIHHSVLPSKLTTLPTPFKPGDIVSLDSSPDKLRIVVTADEDTFVSEEGAILNSHYYTVIGRVIEP